MGAAAWRALLGLALGIAVVAGVPAAAAPSPRAAASLQVQFGVEITGTCGLAPFNATFLPNVTGGTPPYRYDWQFGDGSPNSTAESPTHAYRTAGPYGVNLTVTDAVGVSGNRSQTVVNLASGCPIRVTSPWLVLAVAGGIAAALVAGAYAADRRRKRHP